MKISRKHILLVYGESPQAVWCCGDTMSLLRGNVATERPTRNDTSNTSQFPEIFTHASITPCALNQHWRLERKRKKGNADIVTLFQH